MCFFIIFQRVIGKERDIDLPNMPSGMGNMKELSASPANYTTLTVS